MAAGEARYPLTDTFKRYKACLSVEPVSCEGMDAPGKQAGKCFEGSYVYDLVKIVTTSGPGSFLNIKKSHRSHHVFRRSWFKQT